MEGRRRIKNDGTMKLKRLSRTEGKPIGRREKWSVSTRREKSRKML